VDEARTDQLAHGTTAGVLRVATVGIGVKHKDQLVHREPGRMFVEEKRQDRACPPLPGREDRALRDP
jgi:hypothetical protein